MFCRLGSLDERLPRGSDGLIERGVDVSRSGVDQSRKGFDVCAQEFLQTSVFQYLGNYRAFPFQLLQHLFARHKLSGFGFLGLVYDVKFAKEYVAHLFG